MEYLLPLKALYLLLAGVALFWIIVYILVIYEGFKDRSCGMPLASICANITWEFLFTFCLPFHPLQQIITLIWFLLDCIILYQYLRFSKGKYPPRVLHAIVMSLLAIALLLHYGMSVEFNDAMGIYSAFGINLMMSLLFIRMLLIKGLEGQSLSIGFFKLIGTVCASIFCYAIYPQSVLLAIMYSIIFVLDLLYIVLFYREKRGSTLRAAG